MKNIRPEIKNIIWIALFTSLFVWLSVYLKPQQDLKKSDVVTAVVQEQNIQIKDVEKWLLALPDSAFKSNLLTVLGAEYGGNSEELNDLMKAFIEIKLQELSKNKSI